MGAVRADRGSRPRRGGSRTYAAPMLGSARRARLLLVYTPKFCPCTYIAVPQEAHHAVGAPALARQEVEAGHPGHPGCVWGGLVVPGSTACGCWALGGRWPFQAHVGGGGGGGCVSRSRTEGRRRAVRLLKTTPVCYGTGKGVSWRRRVGVGSNVHGARWLSRLRPPGRSIDIGAPAAAPHVHVPPRFFHFSRANARRELQVWGNGGRPHTGVLRAPLP